MRLLTLHEYLAIPHKNTHWLIQDLLLAGSFNVLWGPPKSGKTLLTLGVSIALASGTPWMGHVITQPYKVLFLEFDISQNVLCEMFTNLLSVGKLPDLPNIFIPHADDFRNLYPIDIRYADKFHIFSRMVETVKPDIVIIDCLAETADINENEQLHMKQVVSKLKQLTVFHPTAPCACLLIHHTIKFDYNDSQHPVPSPLRAGRGNGYLGGAIDMLWFQHRLTSDSDPAAVLHIIPRSGQPQQLAIRQGPGGWWEQG